MQTSIRLADVETVLRSVDLLTNPKQVLGSKTDGWTIVGGFGRLLTVDESCDRDAWMAVCER